MNGTEKQIAWAEKIKTELLSQVEAEAVKWESRKCNSEERRQRADGMAKAYRDALENYLRPQKAENIAKKRNASYWIDGRNDHFSEVHRRAMIRFDKAFPKQEYEENPNYIER